MRTRTDARVEGTAEAPLLAPSAARLARLVDRQIWNALGAVPEDRGDGDVTVITMGAPASAVRAVLRGLGHDFEVREGSESAVTDGWRALDAHDADLRGAEGQVVDRAALVRVVLALGLVEESAYVDAVLEQARTGSAAVDILVANLVISQHELAAVLAHETGVQRVELDPEDVDHDVARQVPLHLAHRLRCLPVHQVDDLVFLAVVDVLSLEQLDALAPHFDAGTSFHQLLVTRSGHGDLLQQVHREWLSRQSTSALREERPHDSAYLVVTGPQKTGLIAVVLVVLGCAGLWPMATLVGVVALCSLAYLVVSVYRYRLIARALGRQLATDVTDAELASLDERELPVYTILVPLYKEAGIVRRLVEGLNALDYPRTKLDVKLLCEEDDVETIETIRGLDLAPHFQLVVVPDSLPKTKPKACNYGLFLAEGEYAVIFDAEDRPDRDQLKKAFIAFRNAEPDVVCVQSKLNYFNGDQNLLTGWFANEYSLHYELLLPSMAHDRVPIPLGGTSNHFIMRTLVDLGGWDPYNVTEDADLGIRLARAGLRTIVIDSITLEEANSEVGNWIRQRSRWIKGYMQTWLVHMRHPVRVLSELGPRGFLSFNLIVGGAFVHLLNPIFWTLTTLYAFTRAGSIEQLFPGPVFYAAVLMLVVGNFLFVFLNLAGSLQCGAFELSRAALLSPLYWALMSWAAWKGFLQLFTNPFYWEKTEHGLDQSAS